MNESTDNRPVSRPLPLREVSELMQLAKRGDVPMLTQTYDLIDGVTKAALAALKPQYAGGWLFLQEGFVIAVRKIREARGDTYDTPLENYLPAAWNTMADAVEGYAKFGFRGTGWPRLPDGGFAPRSIPRDINGGWNHPISADATQGLFDFCFGHALASVEERDRDAVETLYKTGVANVPLYTVRTLQNATQSLQRIEGGMATHEDVGKVLAEVRAVREVINEFGEKLDDKLGAAHDEARAARVAAERAGDELADWRQWLVDNMNNQPGASTPRKRVVLKTLKPELGVAYVKNAIIKVWRDFTEGVADCEPLGKLRTFGQQRSYRECLEIHGNEKIWNGHTLNDLLAVPESGKTPEQVFESIVHSSNETERQTRAKSKVC